MRIRTLVAMAFALTACSQPITTPVASDPGIRPDSEATTSIVSADTTGTSDGVSHTPVWLTIKYRPDAVDVADPRFDFLDGGSSSLVDAAFYDPPNEYMIVSLNGTAYHYCGLPRGVWSSFTMAASLGSFFNTDVKGRFDCRSGFVPDY